MYFTTINACKYTCLSCLNFELKTTARSILYLIRLQILYNTTSVQLISSTTRTYRVFPHLIYIFMNKHMVTKPLSYLSLFSEQERILRITNTKILPSDLHKHHITNTPNLHTLFCQSNTHRPLACTKEKFSQDPLQIGAQT